MVVFVHRGDGGGGGGVGGGGGGGGGAWCIICSDWTLASSATLL